MNLIILRNLSQNLKLKLLKTFTSIIIKSFGVLKNHTKDLNVKVITGGATLNPVILGVVNGAGIILSTYGKMMNYKKKIELTKIAFTTYEKVLVELRSALRGDDFHENEFIEKMKILDEMIIDQTPLADKFIKKYNKNFK